MPNRLIRPGILDSEKINTLKPEEQMFFIRLMLVADDYGCFDARLKMIKAHCFPISDIKIANINKMLLACCHAGLVTVYTVSEKDYLVIHNFKQRMRLKRRKYPQPPANIEGIGSEDIDA
jgi:hypothetical protein